MTELAELLITAVASFAAASGGFWVYLKNRSQSKDATTRLLMGLAHDKIVTYGIEYVARGYVTKDEFEDLTKFFFEPYRELGGNGTAERIMHLVQRLPLTPASPVAKLVEEITIRSTDDDGDHLT